MMRMTMVMMGTFITIVMNDDRDGWGGDMIYITGSFSASSKEAEPELMMTMMVMLVTIVTKKLMMSM